VKQVALAEQRVLARESSAYEDRLRLLRQEFEAKSGVAERRCQKLEEELAKCLSTLECERTASADLHEAKS
jgi:hypothetical protein